MSSLRDLYRMGFTMRSSLAFTWTTPRERAVLTVNVDIGDSDDDASQSSENYRAARIRFFEIQFVVTDPPTTGDSYSGLSMIDTGSGEPRTSPCSLPPIRKDCFLCWIFVTQWNSFIRISARDVALGWVDDLRTSHSASV